MNSLQGVNSELERTAQQQAAQLQLAHGATVALAFTKGALSRSEDQTKNVQQAYTATHGKLMESQSETTQAKSFAAFTTSQLGTAEMALKASQDEVALLRRENTSLASDHKSKLAAARFETTRKQRDFDQLEKEHEETGLELEKKSHAFQ